MVAWIICNVAAVSDVVHIDAAHRWGGCFPFGLFHSGVAVVDSVLLVNSMDVGVVSRVQLYSRACVRAGGGRVGGAATTDLRTFVPASGIPIVGSRPGTAGPMGVGPVVRL